MAEDFHGTTPLFDPGLVKPVQERAVEQPIELLPVSDLSYMDKDYADMQKRKAEEAAAAAAAAAATPPADEPTDELAPDGGVGAPPVDVTPRDDAPPVTPDVAPDVTPDVLPADALPDPHPDMQPPPRASEATKANWNVYKAQVAKDLSERDRQINDLTTRLTQAEESLQNSVPADEVQPLKEFKAKLDIEADPEFQKKFTGRVEEINEFIYHQMGNVRDANGAPVFPPDAISKIKGLGGLQNTNYEALLERIPDQRIQRLIQSKLDEVDQVNFDKERQLKAAKADVNKYVQERQAEYQKTVTHHRDATVKDLREMLGRLDWMQEKPLPPSATEEVRKVYADRSKFQRDVVDNINAALEDDSPNMRAILIAGMAQLLNVKRELPALKEQLKNETTRREQLEAKLKKIQQSSSSDVATTSAPSTPAITAPKIDVHTTAMESIDLLRKQQVEGHGS